jgi:hypothetical protein
MRVKDGSTGKSFSDAAPLNSPLVEDTVGVFGDAGAPALADDHSDDELGSAEKARAVSHTDDNTKESVVKVQIFMVYLVSSELNSKGFLK